MTDIEPHHGAAHLDVGILHDRFPGIGGGEEFAIEAARALDAPIYTMYVADGVEPPEDIDLIPLRQEKYTTGISGKLLEWKNEGMNPLETLSVPLDMTDADAGVQDHDIVFSSAPLSKHYVPGTDQTVINYPHSPPRWLYDSYRDRMADFDYPFVGMALRGYAMMWRSWDKAANDHIDHFIANSELVRDRIQRHYRRDASVVYPPVTGDWRNDGDEGYYVTWSRLAPEKRIDLIAEAFTELDERLVIAGDGEERETIENIAEGHDNIEVLGYVDDIESLVARSRAVVYAPVREDFGLVGAEAIRAGKPLIGVNEGYTQEQVTPTTGVPFDPSVANLRETIRAFDPDAFDATEIQAVGEKYSQEQFVTGLRETIAAVGRSEITDPMPDVATPTPQTAPVQPDGGVTDE